VQDSVPFWTPGLRFMQWFALPCNLSSASMVRDSPLLLAFMSLRAEGGRKWVW
jgi:hypothetical protein